MAWPADDLDVSQADDGNDRPRLFRPMMVRIILRLKSIIGSRGVANGVAALDAAGKVPLPQLPAGGASSRVSLWSPAGAYQTFAAGSTTDLTVSDTSTYEILTVLCDVYQAAWREQTGSGDSLTHINHPEIPWRGYPSIIDMHRASLSTAIGYAYPPARTISIGLRLTTATTCQVKMGIRVQARIYGLYGGHLG